LVTTLEAVEEIFLNYFQEVLTTSNLRGVNECTVVVTGVVTEAMNKDLLEAVTMEEVSQALSQIVPLKARVWMASRLAFSKIIGPRWVMRYIW
jgi:hypothetical protein